jgi:hypothetical protein
MHQHVGVRDGAEESTAYPRTRESARCRVWQARQRRTSRHGGGRTSLASTKLSDPSLSDARASGLYRGRRAGLWPSIERPPARSPLNRHLVYFRRPSPRQVETRHYLGDTQERLKSTSTEPTHRCPRAEAAARQRRALEDYRQAQYACCNPLRMCRG